MFATETTSTASSQPRAIIINETSKSVTGSFDFLDSLTISTVSGSINISINPHTSSNSSPIPASLHLSSVSGSITVHFPGIRNTLHPIPDRIYTSNITSTSGSLTVTVPHNSQTSLSTTSGTIKASIHPLGKQSSLSTITLSNMSGSTSLTLFPHLTFPSLPLRSISTHFYGTSGSLNVVFPITWEGEVKSQTFSGAVKCARWEGLNRRNDGGKFSADIGGNGGDLLIKGESVQVELEGRKVEDFLGINPRAMNAGITADHRGIEQTVAPPSNVDVMGKNG